MHRLDQTEQSDLTKIVAQVIGYGLAEQLLNSIDCINVNATPAMWKGQLNTSYCIGGKLKENRFVKNKYFKEKLFFI
jgi:hypothetical protein